MNDTSVESTLHTSTERIGTNRVKMRIEAPEEALDPALEGVYRRWAHDIKVPGFRKGKIPRQIIDTRVGKDTIREEALNEALPDLYLEALRSEELEAIAAPEIEVVTFELGAPLVFEATVDLRPEVVVPDLRAIEIEAPEVEVTESDLDDQVERLRERFAELEPATREARQGDYVIIDLKGYRGDELVEGASAPDLLYEVGSGSGPPRLDDELVGNRAGAILKFTDAMPSGAGELAGAEISFTVLLKEVKARKLPPVDDEFAKNAGEFETLEDLRADLRERLADVKKQLATEQTRQLALEALVNASDLEAPERLVDDELEHRLSHIDAELAEAGLTLDQYAARSEQTELEVRSEIRADVMRSVKAELLLEQVAREQDLQISQEDVGREIAYLAARTNTEPQELAQKLASSGRLRSVVADIMRRKALDHVVENVTIRGDAAPEGDEAG